VGTSVGIGARVTGDTNNMLSDARIRGQNPFGEKQKTLSLGIYPDISLAKARACHLEPGSSSHTARARMMLAWADHLDSLQHQKPDSPYKTA
jgi:hypothetical protein